MDPTDDMRPYFEPDGQPIQLKSAEQSTPAVPDTSHFFCARCHTGPLMSWEKRDVGCAYCEHQHAP